MKKKSLLLAVALFFSILSTLTFTACDSDTLCYLDVKVVDATNKTAVSGATVTLSAKGSTDANIPRTGVTNEQGIYQTSYAAPFVVEVKATKDDKKSSTYTARLKDGEVVEVEVYL